MAAPNGVYSENKYFRGPTGFFGKISLRGKLYSLILLQVSILLLVYAYSSAVVEKEITRQLTGHNSGLNYQNAAMLRDCVAGMKNACASTLNLENPSATRDIELLLRQLNQFQNINLSFRNVEKLWSGYLRETPYLNSMTLCPFGGAAVYMHRGSDSYYLTAVDPSAGWIGGAAEKKGDYHIGAEDGELVLSRAIIIPQKYEKPGVIQARSDMSFLEDRFMSHRMFASQRFGVFIDGVSVAGDTEMDIGQIRAAFDTDTADQFMLIDKRQNMVYLRYQYDGPEEIVSFTEIPYDEVFAQAFSKNIGLLLAMGAFVAASFLLVALIVRNILKSMKLFKKAFLQIESGQFGLTIDDRVEKDLQGFLDSYNRMTVKLGELIREVYEKNLTQRTLEIQMLRGQINPHFFYNTLEALRMSVMLGREENNARIIEYLGMLLRYGVSSKAELVCLSEEIRHLEYYVELQNMRLDTRIDLRVFIPPELSGHEAIKLMFQPLVENSILHGMPPGRETMEIHIMAYVEEGSVIFTVWDNGTGIPEAAENEINQYLDSSAEDENIGIGIKNIHRRIQLHYGSSYGLRIRARPGNGTEVTITVPYKGARRQ